MQKPKVFGLTNQITIQKQVLIKTSQAYCDAFLNRDTEMIIYKHLTTLNQAWYVIPFNWHNSEVFTSQTNYINDAHTLSTMRLDRDLMQQVIDLIKLIHNLKIPNVHQFDPQAFLMFFKQQVATIPQLSQYDAQVQMIIDHYWDDNTPSVFSHNDLILDNFLYVHKTCKIIDFEYACYNHYLFDYASFISESLTPAQSSTFIALLNLTSKQTQKLHQLIIYQNYLWAYWAQYMYQHTKNDIFKKIVAIKIQQLATMSL